MTEPEPVINETVIPEIMKKLWISNYKTKKKPKKTG